MAGHVRHEQRLFALIDGTLGQITEAQAAAALNLFATGQDGVAQYRVVGGGPEELYDQVHSDWLSGCRRSTWPRRTPAVPTPMS